MSREPGTEYLAIYEEHLLVVFRYISYRTESRETAEDLTQLTFERALKAWPRFDPERASAKTWLLAIAKNAVIDHARSDRSRTTSSIDELTERDEPSEPAPELRGVDPTLAAALSRLSQPEREALALRFGGDLRGPEIAEMLDLTLANVQQILSRALRKLRRELESAQSASGPHPAAPSAASPSRTAPDEP